jgi:hypothetical protein
MDVPTGARHDRTAKFRESGARADHASSNHGCGERPPAKPVGHIVVACAVARRAIRPRLGPDHQMRAERTIKCCGVSSGRNVKGFGSNGTEYSVHAAGLRPRAERWSRATSI